MTILPTYHIKKFIFSSEMKDSVKVDVKNAKMLNINRRPDFPCSFESVQKENMSISLSAKNQILLVLKIINFFVALLIKNLTSA